LIGISDGSRKKATIPILIRKVTSELACNQDEGGGGGFVPVNHDKSFILCSILSIMVIVHIYNVEKLCKYTIYVKCKSSPLDLI
jgi:hypothetical protein